MHASGGGGGRGGRGGGEWYIVDPTSPSSCLFFPFSSLRGLHFLVVVHLIPITSFSRYRRRATIAVNSPQPTTPPFPPDPLTFPTKMDRGTPKAMFTDMRSLNSEATDQQLIAGGVREDKFDRPKGAWKQTVGSTMAAIGELIGNRKMEAKGDAQLKAGMQQEGRGIDRSVGSRLT